jgi:hypothetical protein
MGRSVSRASGLDPGIRIGPEFRHGLREFDRDLRQAAVRRAQPRYAAFLFLARSRLHEHEGLSELDFSGQQHKRSVGAHRDGECFFAEWVVLRGFASNDQGHVQESSRAASSFLLGGWRHFGAEYT